MPSTDPTEDEIRAIAREESRNVVRSELKSYGYGVVGLVVGFVGLSLLFGAFLSGNPALIGFAVLATVALIALLLW